MTTALPLWPFALLAVLVALGLRQSRARVVQPQTLRRVALVMLVLSLYGVTSAFGASAGPVLAWAAGFAVAAVPGQAWLAPRGLVREGDAVRVPGSWLPLALMLGLFVIKFALGFAAGAGAHVLHEAWFCGVISAALGLFSGAFAARAVAVHRFARIGGLPA